MTQKELLQKQTCEAFSDNDVEGLTTLISGGLANIPGNEKYVYAVRKLNMLLTPKNQIWASEETKAAWDAAVEEYDESNANAVESTEAATGDAPGPVRSAGETTPVAAS